MTFFWCNKSFEQLFCIFLYIIAIVQKDQELHGDGWYDCSPRVKPIYIDCPLVVGCSTGHASHLLHVNGWDRTKKLKCTSNMFFSKVVSVILGSSYPTVVSSVVTAAQNHRNCTESGSKLHGMCKMAAPVSGIFVKCIEQIFLDLKEMYKTFQWETQSTGSIFFADLH